MIKPIEPEADDSALDVLNRKLALLADDYNHTPYPEIGGFTPDMLFRLNQTEWNTPECPLQFDTTLPLSVLPAAPVFTGMRNLLRNRKGRFEVPKNKQRLLKEAAAGELAAMLFTANFRKYNLGYMTRYPEGVDAIQYNAGYALFLLGKLLRSWTPVRDLRKRVCIR